MPPAPTTFASLRTPKTLAQNKQDLLNDLAALGFGAFSWETGSVPSGLVEIQAGALTNFQIAEQIIAESGLVDYATGDALDLHSDQVYDNQRFPGLVTIGRVRLTDVANAGPYTFAATSTSFSVGLGGLLYNGTGGSVTIPKGGSAYVTVQSQSVGASYAQVATGAINTFARGAIPGVSVTNESSWITATAGGQQGTNAESDPQLQTRDRSKWGTLGTGSPEKAYVNWALTAGKDFAAGQQVKKCVVYSNYSIFDPGRVDVIIAGTAGPVGADVVAAVQNYIAPSQIGGDKIPETARAVVSSALLHTVVITATLYVQAAFNTADFQNQVKANVDSYFADLAIGALVSQERIIEVLLYPAGLSSGVIVDAAVTSPAADLQLAYNEVAVADYGVSGSITFVSV